ncbi:putative addiction module antidote protein [Escherichia coli]|uniref:Antitoxin ParD n=1 Tax=Escherichia coli TaxID=562 RepID=A0A376LNX7_ECOLX|nr:putative addiction module antidote protein [Escherichia coli]
MARTMTVDLGDELREFIESLIESGDYRTQSEVIRESLRLLREKQAESRLQALRDMLAEGLSSGEAQPWEEGRVFTEGESRDKEIMCVL